MKIEQAKFRTVVTTTNHGLEKGMILMASRFADGNIEYDLCKITEVINKSQVAVRSLYFWERWIWRIKNYVKRIRP